MANKIQQRRGLKANMPTGSAGELLYATDTRELFIGTGNGNVNMGGSHWYRGTAMSGTSATVNAHSYSACPEVKLDDIYMNISSGNIYACTTAGKGSAAKWTYQGCMRGPQGATGARGATGKGIPESLDAVEYMDGLVTVYPPTSPNPDIGVYYFLNFSKVGEDYYAQGLCDIDGNVWNFNTGITSAKSYIVELTSTGKCQIIATINNIFYDNFLDYIIAKVSGII